MNKTILKIFVGTITVFVIIFFAGVGLEVGFEIINRRYFGG